MPSADCSKQKNSHKREVTLGDCFKQKSSPRMEVSPVVQTREDNYCTHVTTYYPQMTRNDLPLPLTCHQERERECGKGRHVILCRFTVQLPIMFFNNEPHIFRSSSVMLGVLTITIFCVEDL